MTLPLVWPGALAGTLLAFVIALGEYVASVLVFVPSNRPISIAIASELRDFNLGAAAAYGVVLMLLIGVLMFVAARVDDGGVLIRRGGEGLQALQHIVATAFRKQLGEDNRIVIDCMNFRREKDAELRQMAKFMAEKARSSADFSAAGSSPALSRSLALAHQYAWLPLSLATPKRDPCPNDSPPEIRLATSVPGRRTTIAA